jgi:hypothetical protein
MSRIMQPMYDLACLDAIPAWRSCEVGFIVAHGVSVSTMKQKPVWEKENPKKKSTPLSSSQKASAKARAAKAGRPYPNLVDNMAASRMKKGK